MLKDSRQDFASDQHYKWLWLSKRPSVSRLQKVEKAQVDVGMLMIVNQSIWLGQ